MVGLEHDREERSYEEDDLLSCSIKRAKGSKDDSLLNESVLMEEGVKISGEMSVKEAELISESREIKRAKKNEENPIL